MAAKIIEQNGLAVLGLGFKSEVWCFERRLNIFNISGAWFIPENCQWQQSDHVSQRNIAQTARLVGA